MRRGKARKRGIARTVRCRYKPAILRAARRKGHAEAARECSSDDAERDDRSGRLGPASDVRHLMRSKMPKLKTKSGAKKRFKLTATGKVKVQQAGKRHGMIKRTAKFVRNARGTAVLSDSDARIIKKNFLLNG
jgi:large subunit ribosomal protein L35